MDQDEETTQEYRIMWPRHDGFLHTQRLPNKISLRCQTGRLAMIDSSGVQSSKQRVKIYSQKGQHYKDNKAYYDVLCE